ncbi:hypothetical protein [Lacinutrix sp. MEBiC02404]
MKTLTNLDFQLKIDSEINRDQIIEYCYNLRLKSKHITNYIELNCLKQLKFKTEEFRGIVISLMHGYDDKKWSNYDNPFITPSTSIGIYIRFDKKKYDSLKTDNEFRDFIYEYMVESFKKIETKYEIPSTEMLASYEELKSKNFINERLSIKKSDRTRKLLAELHSSVTIDKFILTLKVYQDKKEVYNKIVLETVPDTLVYANKMKKLVIEETAIKVLGIGDKVTFSLPLEDILK